MTTTVKCAIFASGVTTGLALAAFFTSRAGTEFRNQFRDKVQKGTQALRDKKHEIEDTVERERKGMGAAFEAGKRAYEDVTHQAQAAR